MCAQADLVCAIPATVLRRTIPSGGAVETSGCWLFRSNTAITCGGLIIAVGETESEGGDAAAGNFKARRFKVFDLQLIHSLRGTVDAAKRGG